MRYKNEVGKCRNRKILQKFNTEDILSGIIEMQLCSYSQLQDERIPAAEYFASNAICLYITDASNDFTWNDYLQLEEFARNIYKEDIFKTF